MGHTTLTFRDRDDYFHDADVLVVLHLLLTKARAQPPGASRHPDLIPGWEHALDSTGPGFVGLDFDARDAVSKLTRLLSDQDAHPVR
jgi:hypothetical protein